MGAGFYAAWAMVSHVVRALEAHGGPPAPYRAGGGAARQTEGRYPSNRSATPWTLMASSSLTVSTLPPSSTQMEAISVCNGSE